MQKTAEELNLLLKDMPPKYSLWKHKKTGNVYLLMSGGLVESSLEPVAIYRIRHDLGGVWWVRPMAEFLDKFERVETL